MTYPLQGGGNIVQTLRKSYSLSDLSEPDTAQVMNMEMEMSVAEVERRPGARTNRQRPTSLRSSSSTVTGAKEMDAYVGGGHIEKTGRRGLMQPDLSHVRSSEDISSSGYSSGDAIGPITRQGSLTRVNPLTRPRIKAKRSEVRNNIIGIIWISLILF